MVPGLGRSAKRSLALDDPRGDRGIRAAGEEHRLNPGLDVLHGVADGVSRRCAPGCNDVAIAAEPKTHLDFARHRAHGPAGNAEQTDLLDVSGMPEAVLLFGEFLRPSARADDNAD